MTLLLFVLIAACARSSVGQTGDLRDGDIAFQISQSRQSQAVALATRGTYTHMGLVTLRGGRAFVLEAGPTVRVVPFSTWVAHGRRGHVVVKRLRDADKILRPDVRARFEQIARVWLGRSYDLWFQWSDERLYCSELVYKLYDRAAGVQVGTLARARDFHLDAPAVRAEIKKRFGASGVPLRPDEPAVSPQAMFDDPRLMTVYTR